MYVCGLTVYDYCHLGHARFLVVFDLVVRYFRAIGYQVTYVRNITDIDDKIITRAQENNEEIDALTDRFIKAMHEDCQKLNVAAPDIEPRATKSMDDIIKMISGLEKKGYSYTASSGDVYYEVNKFDDYGKLSGRKLEDQIQGKRVEVVREKKSPEDFILWKMAKPGEPNWDSPWGKGRPGWHIECSAMSTSCLGEHFDIHGGGMDLKFPHHENEIAQTEAYTGKIAVNYWIHNGFVNVINDETDEEEKMSKSLNNFFTVRDILKLYQAEEIRFFILNSHYRSPLNYSKDSLENGKAALTTLYTALRDVNINSDYRYLPDSGDEYDSRFRLALDDDFNTVGAIAVLFDIAHKLNRSKQEAELETASRLAAQLIGLGLILGLLQTSAETFLQQGVESTDGLSASEIDALIQERNQARSDKNFEQADKIRQQLDDLGVILEDNPNGTSWRK